MAWLIAPFSKLLTVSLLPTAGASGPPVGGPTTTITLAQGAWGGCLQMALAVGVGSVGAQSTCSTRACPRIFAAGDVRLGSKKRCGAAVGEGAMAVQFIHAHLAKRPLAMSKE